MFGAARDILDHMYATDVSVSEAETLQCVEKFMMGRNPNPQLSCWEFECQAGRTYVAVDLLGRIHACGTDLTNHVLGHIGRDLDEHEYKRKLQKLHHKSSWVVRCFDCDARRICRHSCPTSDHNSEEYKELECRYTKLLYEHFSDYPWKAAHVNEVVMARRGPQHDAFVPVEQLSMATAN